MNTLTIVPTGYGYQKPNAFLSTLKFWKDENGIPKPLFLKLYKGGELSCSAILSENISEDEQTKGDPINYECQPGEYLLKIKCAWVWGNWWATNLLGVSSGYGWYMTNGDGRLITCEFDFDLFKFTFKNGYAQDRMTNEALVHYNDVLWFNKKNLELGIVEVIKPKPSTFIAM